MSYSAEVLADSPLAHWRLGESSGTTASDSSGNSHDGFYVGSVTLGTTGLLPYDSNTCGDFAGSGGSSVGVTYGSWMNTTNVTVEAWINADSFATASRIIVERDAAVRCFQLAITTAGKIQFVFWTTSAGPFIVTGATTLSTGTTYHVAATFDGSVAKVYLNGAVDGTPLTQAGSLKTGVVPLHVGIFDVGTSNLFDGRIDEVAYYPTALSASRLLAHHTAGMALGSSLALTSPTATASLSASYIAPITATLGLEAPLSSVALEVTEIEPVVATLDVASSSPTVSLSATYAPEPVLVSLSLESPLPLCAIALTQRVFVPPTVLEYSDDHFFGRFGIPVGQSVVLTDGHYVTTPYPWLGEIADLTEGTDWFQGGRTYQISSATAATLLADGYTLTEV